MQRNKYWLTIFINLNIIIHSKTKKTCILKNICKINSYPETRIWLNQILFL